MNANTWHLAVALAVTASALWGQDAGDAGTARFQRERLLTENIERIQIAVSLDHAGPYFPGEAMTATVTMTNATASPLEVPDPRVTDGAYFEYSQQGGHGTKSKSEWPEFPVSWPQDWNPTLLMQPGQSITMVYRSEDCAEACMTFRDMPKRPGNYRMRFRVGRDPQVFRNDNVDYVYGWGGGEPVDFQVVAPKVEASAVVLLDEFRTYQNADMSAPKTVREAAVLVAVDLGGQHLVLVGRGNVTAGETVERTKEGTLWDPLRMSPWVRLATVQSKITKLTGTADPSGQITLEYTTEDGAGSRISLDKNRHPL